MQSCIQFAGDKEGVRGWANKTGLTPLPAEGQKRFLYGLPGVVFDASNTGRQVRPDLRGRRFLLGCRAKGQRIWRGHRP